MRPRASPDGGTPHSYASPFASFPVLPGLRAAAMSRVAAGNTAARTSRTRMGAYSTTVGKVITRPAGGVGRRAKDLRGGVLQDAAGVVGRAGGPVRDPLGTF